MGVVVVLKWYLLLIILTFIYHFLTGGDKASEVLKPVRLEDETENKTDWTYLALIGVLLIVLLYNFFTRIPPRIPSGEGLDYSPRRKWIPARFSSLSLKTPDSILPPSTIDTPIVSTRESSLGLPKIVKIPSPDGVADITQGILELKINRVPIEIIDGKIETLEDVMGRSVAIMKSNSL